MIEPSITPVIMAGGNGSRLWPLSRELYPKQFLKLQSEMTMLQSTVQRLKGLHCSKPQVICNEEHRFIVAEQLRHIGMLAQNIILEPVGRNTAPAIALSALTAIADGHDPLLLVLAADHVIKDEVAFCSAVEQAIPFADVGKLVTFGIVANAPETGYGYIKRGVLSSAHEDISSCAFTVDKFVEKPGVEIARHYLESGEYYWNSGMFLFRASRYLEELNKFRPDILKACKAAIGQLDPDMDFIRVNKDAFYSCPDDSIDYAVMEHTTDAVVVPMDAGWSDVGSWSSLWDISDKDNRSNIHHGDVINVDSKNNYVFAENGLVATVGIENVVIVQTKDAVLVAAKDRVQDVKQIVSKLKDSGRSEHHVHREVYRPWGKYDSIDVGHRYQVKRITVKPGEQLSLQMHHHRAEHWIVVAGTAKITHGDNIQLVGENQSIYIPLGTVHSLENPGKIPTEIIEVQTGSYLGDDDVVRFCEQY
ncbi:mannose-1-phosphate guanylyltransferase/mannose-6-phosphate isomerase [Aeromonas veronii]|uniref:mannose-1-phosphate guanylyltransferase/mannose-6-phosphate isomerase n=1 Tax=Aeromonas veronii TaxID=654 RepID=UPI0038B5C37D